MNEVEQLKQKVEELENNWKRALADYKNLEKRVAEEKTLFMKFANSVLLLKFLSVFDNLEMLERHIDDTGLKLTIKEFKQILSDEGISEVKALGTDFDAETMDAVEMVEGEENKVIEIIRRGYKLHEKLLRPARVKVGKG